MQSHYANIRRPPSGRPLPCVARPAIHALVLGHPLVTADPASALRVSEALYNHILEGTTAGYDSATRHYLLFCNARGLAPWPTDPILLVAWLRRLACTIKVSSMRQYLAGVRNTQLNMGMPWPWSKCEPVHRCLRFLARKFPEPGTANKLPISLAILRRILPLLPGWPSPTAMTHTDRLFATASILAVKGFLRGGEFLTHPRSARPILCMSHVQKHVNTGPAYIVISVPQPKTRHDLITVDVPCFDTPEASFF